MKKYRLLVVSLAALVLVVGGFAVAKHAAAQDDNVTTPIITSITPNHGTVNAGILVQGFNFFPSYLKLVFSNGDGHDGAIFDLTASYPTPYSTFGFFVPGDIQPACLPGCREPSHKLQPGQYQVHVESDQGVSNNVLFTVD